MTDDFGNCLGGYHECTARFECQRRAECKTKNNERGACNCDMKRYCQPGKQRATVEMGRTKETCFAYKGLVEREGKA